MTCSLEFGLNTFGDVATGPDSPPHAQVIRHVIDEAVEAEALGVDVFGVGEHHRADFAVSAPEVVLAAIAGRTRRMRLGSAVTVLSSDDPVRVFQRFSTLDAASHGRAEVILGRGSFTESFPLFGYDIAHYEALFEEKLELFAALVRRRSVTWKGKLRAPLTRQCIYPPLQTVTLKTWVAVGASPNSVLRAARHDLPMMLGIVGGEAERFRPFVELYRQAFVKLGRPAQAVGVHSAGHVADTDAQARNAYWAAYQPMRDRLGAERRWPPITRGQYDMETDRGALYVGSPETVAGKIAATVRALGASRFDMKYSIGTLPFQTLERSIELYGTRVIPLVREMLG